MAIGLFLKIANLRKVRGEQDRKVNKN